MQPSGKQYLIVLKHHINNNCIQLATKTVKTLLNESKSEYIKLEAAKIILNIANSQALKEEPDKIDHSINVIFDFPNPNNNTTSSNNGHKTQSNSQ